MAFSPVSLPRAATLADLEALPPSMKGELIDGVLYAMTRPRSRHQNIAGTIHADLFNPLQRGRGGPGGWWVLVEPGIELPGAPEIAPDIAGWRRERLPSLPRDASIQIAPDWVCEVLSPTTRGYHFIIKRALYARSKVDYLWEIDLEARTLTVLKRIEDHWLVLGSHNDETTVRLAPFDDVPCDVAAWWTDSSGA